MGLTSLVARLGFFLPLLAGASLARPLGGFASPFLTLAPALLWARGAAAVSGRRGEEEAALVLGALPFALVATLRLGSYALSEALALGAAFLALALFLLLLEEACLPGRTSSVAALPFVVLACLPGAFEVAHRALPPPHLIALGLGLGDLVLAYLAGRRR